MYQLAEVLPAVTRRVFEEMYFCSPVYAGPANLVGPCVSGAITFEGALKGEFQLAMTQRLACELTSVFLMTEPAKVTAADGEAMVAELGNVLCSAVMNALAPGEELHFSVPRRISSPEMRPTSPHCFSVDFARPEMAVSVLF